MPLDKFAGDPGLGGAPMKEPGASRGPRRKKKMVKKAQQGQPPIPSLGGMGVAPKSMKGPY